MSEARFAINRTELPPGCLVQATSWNGSAFVAGLCALVRPDLAIEVGCAGGATSIHLAETLKNLGHGRLVAYESNPKSAILAVDSLNAVWPGGDWFVKTGDFFQRYEDDVVDFAFIDIEPKSSYVDVFHRLKLSPRALVVAHDASHGSFVEDVQRLESVMVDSGWLTFVLPQERGFLVGRRS